MYGVLGLLGISIPPNALRYGVRLRGALRLLADAMHVDQRLLLTVIESYHGNFIDGYGTLPAFRDETAVPAARLEHIRTLGTAEFDGHAGMIITAPTITVDGVPLLDDSDAIKEAAGIMRTELVDVLEEQGSMDRWTFSHEVYTQRRQSDGLARIRPGTPSLGLTLIAVTQVEAPHNDIFRRGGEPRVTFCCLVCTSACSVKHKVGLALVVASKHTWRIERHVVA